MLLATTGATWVHTTQQQQTAMANPTHKPTEWSAHKYTVYAYTEPRENVISACSREKKQHQKCP